ncbi:hypothetical protein NLI96_g6616 [Meripilus lineatus]|uniref:CCHC-type domain-containing protein n=1 Tax=Meripilus lineatus TaxID=2056292 RepID=A0AAD5YDP8_9APHY|nr:hypothetical protein NLI96_g6616 [Physisporinus lineatus]
MASSFQHSMPLRNHRTAPIFDSSNPHSLRRYFQDLLWLFEACGVSSDTKRKQYATYYLPIPESDVWTSLSEFDDPQTSFKAFQVTIFALYPETSLDRLYSLVKLQKLVSQTSQADLSSLESLATFYRQFLAHSSFLLRKDRISPREQSQMFLDAIPSRFRSQIASRLKLKFPDHYFDDTHPLSRIFEAAKFVYTFPSSQAVPESSLQLPSPSFDVSNQISHLSLPFDVAKLLEQATKSILDPIVAQLTAAAPESSYSSKLPPVSSQTIPIASTPPVQVPKSPRCFYCAEGGHTIQACPKVEEDLALGRCSRTQLGRVVLPSGADIPRGLSGESLRERLFKLQQSLPSSLEPQKSSHEAPVVAEEPLSRIYTTDPRTFAQLKQELAALRSSVPRPSDSFPSSQKSPPSSQIPQQSFQYHPSSQKFSEASKSHYTSSHLVSKSLEAPCTFHKSPPCPLARKSLQGFEIDSARSKSTQTSQHRPKMVRFEPELSQKAPTGAQSFLDSSKVFGLEKWLKEEYPDGVVVRNCRPSAQVFFQSSKPALSASQNAPASSKSHFVAPNSLQSLPISQDTPSNSQHLISSKIAPNSSKIVRDCSRNLAEHRSACSESINTFSTLLCSLSPQLHPQSSQTSPAAVLPFPQIPLSSPSSQTSPAVFQSASMSPAAPSLSQKLLPLLQHPQTSSQRFPDLVSSNNLRSTSQMSPKLSSLHTMSSQIALESPASLYTFSKSIPYPPVQQSPPDLAESAPALQTAQTSYPTSTSIRSSSEDSQKQPVGVQSSTSRPKVVDFDIWLKEEYPGIVLRRDQSQASQLPLQSSLHPSQASQIVPASSKLPEPISKSSQSLSASPSLSTCAQPSIPWKTKPNLSEIVAYRRTSLSEHSSTSSESISTDSTSISMLSLLASPPAIPPAVAVSPSSLSPEYIAEVVASPHASSNTPPTHILDLTPHEIAPKVPIDLISPQASPTYIPDTLSTTPDISQVENRSQTFSKVVEHRLEHRQGPLDVSRHSSLPTPPESPKSTPASISTRFSNQKASPTASV